MDSRILIGIIVVLVTVIFIAVIYKNKDTYVLNTSAGQAWLNTSDGQNWLGTSDGYAWLNTSDGYAWLNTSAGQNYVPNTYAINNWLRQNPQAHAVDTNRGDLYIEGG